MLTIGEGVSIIVGGLLLYVSGFATGRLTKR